MTSSTALLCSLCRQRVPAGSDLYALDAEWRRRFPAMTGALACQRCALEKHHWDCRHPGTGRYVPGHLRAEGRPEDRDFDSWSHILDSGPPQTMARLFPEAFELQSSGVTDG